MNFFDKITFLNGWNRIFISRRMVVVVYYYFDYCQSYQLERKCCIFLSTMLAKELRTQHVHMSRMRNTTYV